jgi:S-adenosylmethionine:tRNA ribosyltransferase-isomerase
MHLNDFNYELPDELIARYPSATRSASRLLTLDGQSGDVQHHQFADILQLLVPGDLLVFNDTRVIPARLLGTKLTGGKVEVLIERIQSENTILAQISASKTPKPNSTILFERGVQATVLERQNDFFLLKFSMQPVKQVNQTQFSIFDALEKIGHIPLPPYFGREDEPIDRERYQTVYALHNGAVAAPTAGLHFDDALLKQLHAKGIDTAFLTLHVGAGTFHPVRVDDITQHKMHSEIMEISEAVCKKVKAAKDRGGRIVAVGTTSLRSLETAAQSGILTPFSGETKLFIYPGYSFNVVDVLITNFHQPQSTLMMLVCAFAGYESLMSAYRKAIESRYRFLSYGDAMLITRKRI